jgi:hypothetical protein
MSFLRGSANKAVLSSGHKYIYVPQEDFKFLGGLWEDKIASVNCEDKNYCFMKNTTCKDLADLIGPFKIQFGSYDYFSIEPDTYLFDGSEFDHDNVCVFGVLPHPDPKDNDKYILGAPFL